MDVNWMSWKTWATIGVILVIAFAIYAYASTRDNGTQPPQTAGTRIVRTGPAGAAVPGVGAIHTEWLESQSGSYRSERNLFAYKEPPPPPPPKQIIQPPTPPPPPAPVAAPQPAQPAAPQPPMFPYHYIGTFGTAANPIATFSGNGQIVNVRVGETIDGKFVLRSIGIESVEIGYVGLAPDIKTRIPMGQ